MWRLLFCVFIAFHTQYVSAEHLCESVSKEQKTMSCSTQILGLQDQVEDDVCKIDLYPANSLACTTIYFEHAIVKSDDGGITLKPFIVKKLHSDNITQYEIDHTVINITFSNIKWNHVWFRFHDKNRRQLNHCRHIQFSDSARLDHSVIHYDCYWIKTGDNEGQTQYMDFGAFGNRYVARGRFYFYLPTAEMLNPMANEDEWKPFTYVRRQPSSILLHIVPPPASLEITEYKIDVMKECGEVDCKVYSKNISILNNADDVTYLYEGDNGMYYFTVTPIHQKCKDQNKCTFVETPRILIHYERDISMIITVCVGIFIFATMFIYYIGVRIHQSYNSKNYRRGAREIPQPTKVLVIYSPTNPLHAECVASFVDYLRTDYGFDIMYDGDISATSHGDPYIWAEEAFGLASHVMYIVGHAKDTNHCSIYSKRSITSHTNIDVLLLTFVKAGRISQTSKEILNVFFDYSNAKVPIETRHDMVFFLMKDLQKLVSYLSNDLIPKRQILKSEKGRCFMDDLARAQIMNVKPHDVIVKGGHDKLIWADKQILV